MISPSDLDDLRASLFAWDRPGLPASFAVDCARLLNVSDSAISFVGDAGQVILCASSDEARSLDEWEFTLREGRSEEHTSELQSREKIVCRLLLEKKTT